MLMYINIVNNVQKYVGYTISKEGLCMTWDGLYSSHKNIVP